jgi:SprT protein
VLPKEAKNVILVQNGQKFHLINNHRVNLSKKLEIARKLTPFVPDGTAEEVAQLIATYKVRFRISRPRNSKMGDYRAPYGGQGHRISVNGNLNPFAFYITTLHEFAHLITFEKYGHKILPHGAEWQREFGLLLHRSLQNEIFPGDIASALYATIHSPAASSCSDHHLVRILKKYDQKSTLLLEEIPANARFAINGSRIFVKGVKLRKRYRCLEEHSNRVFLVSAIAEVDLL